MNANLKIILKGLMFGGEILLNIVAVTCISLTTFIPLLGVPFRTLWLMCRNDWNVYYGDKGK